MFIAHREFSLWVFSFLGKLLLSSQIYDVIPFYFHMYYIIINKCIDIETHLIENLLEV